MIDLTLNLYTDAKIDDAIIRKSIFSKDPIIIFLDNTTSDSVYRTLNLSRAYSKNVLTLRRFDINQAFAYLLSFSDLNSKRILFMAPASSKNSAVKYAKQLISTLEAATAA